MEKRHRHFFPGYLLYLVLSFYFRIGETRSPECNDKKNSLQGRNASVHVTVCVTTLNQILSHCHAVTLSRHAIHHNNILTSYSFEPLYLNFVLYIVSEKRYVVKMAKNEGANVSRCYVPSLRRFWIVKLSFLTLWPATRVKSSSHAEFYRTLPSITKPISEV